MIDHCCATGQAMPAGLTADHQPGPAGLANI